MVTSQKHRQLLTDKLNKIYGSPKSTSIEMIALITTGKGTMSFNSKDLPVGGSAHNNILYLTLMCLQKFMSLVLADNGRL